MYIQTPATNTASEASSLVVCSDTVVVWMQTQTARNRIYFTGLFDTLPIDRMEELVGK